MTERAIGPWDREVPGGILRFPEGTSAADMDAAQSEVFEHERKRPPRDRQIKEPQRDREGDDDD